MLICAKCANNVLIMCNVLMCTVMNWGENYPRKEYIYIGAQMPWHNNDILYSPVDSQVDVQYCDKLLR